MVSTKFSTNVSNPVSDLLTRIHNANLAHKDDLLVPVSKMSTRPSSRA